MRLSSLITVVAISAGLIGCGQQVEPAKTAQATVSVSVAKQPVEDSFAVKQQKETENQAARNKATEGKVTAIIEKMNALKASTMTGTEGKEFAALIYDSNGYLGSIVAAGYYKATKVEDPGKDCSYCSGFATNEEEQRKRLTSEMLVWAQQNQTLTEKIWDSALPYLRTKSELVMTMRSVKGLLKVPYTEKSFQTLSICLGEIPNDLKKTCQKEADKFGILYRQAIEGVASNDSYEPNARWMIEFLQRRHLNGGDKFAQWSQKLLLKLAS